MLFVFFSADQIDLIEGNDNENSLVHSDFLLETTAIETYFLKDSFSLHSKYCDGIKCVFLG